MAIFFPDNDKRRIRLIELASDTHSFLAQAKTAFREFTTLNKEVNAKVADVYRKSGLTAPLVSSVDILHAQRAIHDMTAADTMVSVSKLLLDLGGLVAISYFAPAATTLLLEAGVLEAETASVILFSALGAELTIGALAGGIIGGLVVGLAVVGIGLAIDAFEGYELRDELRTGIYQTDQMRASAQLALKKSQTLVQLLRAVKDTCDSLLASSIVLTDPIITNIIQKNALPALRAIEAITKETILAGLQSLDRSRNSWTNEDEDGRHIVLPASRPIYVTFGLEAPEQQCPSVPDGLKLTALRDLDSLVLRSNYPIFKIGNVQYWPLSYTNNKTEMAIVAFDSKGNVLKRWDKPGARYVWKIEVDLDANHVVFVGQGGKTIIMKWSELVVAPLTVDPQLLGNYECHKYDTGGKNNWHYVTVKKLNDTTLEWANRAGTRWTLATTLDKDKLNVGKECPYGVQGYKQAAVERNGKLVSGLRGPLNELYLKTA